jgi:hypothetical protein
MTIPTRQPELPETLYRRFWRAVALFAYRRWAVPNGRKPVGLPGNRDPENPCVVYEPRPVEPGDFADCQGDGHYLCKECCHLDRSPISEEPPTQDEIKKFLRAVRAR